MNGRNLGTQNLPKYLVQKIGKDKIMTLLKPNSPRPVLEITPITKDHRTRNYASGFGKQKAKSKWQAIQNGKMEPDVLYPVDEALERAGLI